MATTTNTDNTTAAAAAADGGSSNAASSGGEAEEDRVAISTDDDDERATTTTAARQQQQPLDANDGDDDDDDDDEDHRQLQHDAWRIALYYCYVPIADVERHVEFQRELCSRCFSSPSPSSSSRPLGDAETAKIRGRIRVAPEGVNGVLSGPREDLLRYERELRDELLSSSAPSLIELDVKHCRLRADLPVPSQLFDELSVQVTRRVVSLFEERQEPTKSKKKNKKKKNRKKRSGSNSDGGGAEPLLNATTEENCDACDDEEEEEEEENKGDDDDDDREYRLIREIWSKCEEQQQQSQGAACGVKGAGCADGKRPHREDGSATHLSPSEWNQLLSELTRGSGDNDDGDDDSRAPSDRSVVNRKGPSDVVLLDCRNCYESDVGYFRADNASTILTNTRKYSELPRVFVQQADRFMKADAIMMYCTGGVRCERASVFLHNLLAAKAALCQQNAANDNNDDDDDGGNPTAGATSASLKSMPKIYQLHGGIQRYIENPEDALFFRGKNFVFDPRRTDPSTCPGNDTVGRCLVCNSPHDDYDNGRAPIEGCEARCWNCRVLILVCDACRAVVSCWGEADGGKNDDKPRMFCGGPDGECVHRPPPRELPPNKVIFGIRHATSESNEHMRTEGNRWGDATFRDDMKWRDSPLSEKGRHEVEQLKKQLLEPNNERWLRDVELIVVSPLTRSLETYALGVRPALSTLCVDAPSPPVKVLPLIAERVYTAADVGHPISILQQRWGDSFQWDEALRCFGADDPWWYTGSSDEAYEEWRPSGYYPVLGEPEAVFERRMNRVDEWILNRPEKTILIVSHWGVLRRWAGDDIKNAGIVRVDAKGHFAIR